MSLCTTPTLACYNRECNGCGVTLAEHHIRNHLKADPEQQAAKRHAWVLVKKDKGQRMRMWRRRTLQDLLSKLQEELAPYSKHVFLYWFQHMQYKLLLSSLSSLPKKPAVAECDFSENYLCEYQGEVQSAYWGYNQDSVYPNSLRITSASTKTRSRAHSGAITKSVYILLSCTTLVVTAQPLSQNTSTSWGTIFSMTQTPSITSLKDCSNTCRKKASSGLQLVRENRWRLDGATQIKPSCSSIFQAKRDVELA